MPGFGREVFEEIPGSRAAKLLEVPAVVLRKDAKHLRDGIRPGIDGTSMKSSSVHS